MTDLEEEICTFTRLEMDKYQWMYTHMGQFFLPFLPFSLSLSLLVFNMYKYPYFDEYPYSSLYTINGNY